MRALRVAVRECSTRRAGRAVRIKEKALQQKLSAEGGHTFEKNEKKRTDLASTYVEGNKQLGQQGVVGGVVGVLARGGLRLEKSAAP